MRAALEEAQKAFDKDEVPIGAVVVCNGEVLSKTHNLRQSANDPTAHAEILAIKEAAWKRGDWRLNGCEIYATKEPCPMCAGAIQQARFDKLIYGCKDKKAGYAGSLYNVLDDKNLPHQVEVISGIDKDNCKTLLQEFFRKKRKRRGGRVDECGGLENR